MNRLVAYLAAGVLCVGCHTDPHITNVAGNSGNAYTRYASGFDVDVYDKFKLLQVFDPWQNSKGVNFSYVLASDPDLVPDSLRHLVFIQTPVKRVITLSTTHVAMIDQLGEVASISGVSGSGFIFNQTLRKRIEEGEVLDVGYDQGLNYESIVNLQPDVLFMYGVEGSVLASAQKLAELKVPVVFCGDYLEAHPLGKAEWVRFFASFYKKERQADQFFEHIDSLYNVHKSLALKAEKKPLVLTGLPWKDTWYMAGGNSFASRFIADAGGQYLWADHPSTQAVPMDLESVYTRAVDADIWINPGAASSLTNLREFDQRFKNLRVLQSGQVYNNNARLNVSGGNDYWESGALRPDLVLQDLIKVFHPDLMTDHSYIYYRQLK